MPMLDDDVLKQTIEIAKCAVSGAGEKSTIILSDPEMVADFIQTVYDKLAEINERLEN